MILDPLTPLLAAAVEPALTAVTLSWSARLEQWAVDLGIVIVALGSLACLYRIVRGPHLADRALGADALSVHLIALVLLLTIRQGTLLLFDGVLVLALLGFAGTVAMAQFIGRPHLMRKNEPRRHEKEPNHPDPKQEPTTKEDGS